MSKIELKCSGEAGDVVVMRHEVAELFRGKGARIVATDKNAGEAKPGMATRIGAVTIAGKSQRPEGCGRTLTLFFGNGMAGNDLHWDDIKPGDALEMEIYFIVGGEFEATIEEGVAA